jgi:hypothetical protein
MVVLVIRHRQRRVGGDRSTRPEAVHAGGQWGSYQGRGKLGDHPAPFLGAGWYLVDVQAHYTISGELVQGGQLLALHTPPGKYR